MKLTVPETSTYFLTCPKFGRLVKRAWLGYVRMKLCLIQFSFRANLAPTLPAASYSLPSQHLRLIVSCWLTTRAKVSPRLIFKKFQNPFSCFFEPREPKNGYFHLDLKPDIFTISIQQYSEKVRYELHLHASQRIVREARDMACFPFEGTYSTIFLKYGIIIIMFVEQCSLAVIFMARIQFCSG